MAAELTERVHHPRLDRCLSDNRHYIAWLLRSRFLPNPPTLDLGAKDAGELTWRERVRYYEWGFFTLNLGTGACSFLIHGIAFPFKGQHAFACVFFILNIAFYLINLTGVFLRAWYHPLVFRRSFTIPGQALFFPTSLLGFATIFVGSVNFGVPHVGPWLVDALYVVYWIYVGASVFCAALLQWTMYDQTRELDSITPAECLPVFPLMLAGTLGATLSGVTSVERASTLIIVSYMFQGCGYFIGLQKLSAWMMRNSLLGHPKDLRITPIFYMAIGPPGFTAFAFLTLGTRAATVFPSHGTFPTVPNAGPTLQVASIFFALMLFGQCLWYLTATTAIWVKALLAQPKGWSMAWFATTFPLVGFLLAASTLGELLGSQFLKVVEVVGCGLVILLWLFNVIMLVLSVAYKRLLVPPSQIPRDSKE